MVLEILEHETGGLLVVVARQDGDDDDEERHDVPYHGKGGDLVQVARKEDVDGRGGEGHEVRHEDTVPSLDFVVWVVQIGHAEEEVGSDLFGGGISSCRYWDFGKAQDWR